jgi:hypothetical protein
MSSLGPTERHESRLVIAGAPGNDDPAIDAAIEALPTECAIRSCCSAP